MFYNYRPEKPIERSDNMPIFDGNLPYTNLHELNLDWVIKKVQENKTRIDELRAELDTAQAELDDLLFLGDLFSVSGNSLVLTGKSLVASNGFVGNLSGNASSATTAQSANTANSAQHALRADTATTAGSATTAQRATTADTATNATHATHATTADTASIGVATGAEVFVTTPDSTRFPKGATSNMTVRVVKNDSTLAPDTGAWLLLDVSEPNNMAIGNPNGGVHRIAIPLDPNESRQEPTARRYIKCRPFMYTTSDRDTIQSISSWYNIWTDDSTPA